jgi:acyl carrier protein
MSPEPTTLEFLRRIIARDFEVDPQLIQPDSRLDDLAIDSLGVIEIMFAVEEQFNITVPPEPPDARTPIDTLGRTLYRPPGGRAHSATKAGGALP